MKRKYGAAAAILGLLLGFEAPLGAAPAGMRTAECFVLIEEGASSEGNSLFLSRMGVEPELLRYWVPTRFTKTGKLKSTAAEGKLSYTAETPVLLEKKGKSALYQVPVTFGGPALPKAEKTVKVDFRLKDLLVKGDILQPGAMAIELAVAKAGMAEGRAWVIDMKRLKDGSLRATVGLSP